MAKVRAKARLRWWSLTNWLKGYKFGPVQRFRCCDHTTPFHYNGCESGTGESAPGATNAPESAPIRKEGR